MTATDEHEMSLTPDNRQVRCSCGWTAQHDRRKVLANKVRRHAAKNNQRISGDLAPPPKRIECAPVECPPVEEVRFG